MHVTEQAPARDHDQGDEDQAERKPANWWLYQALAYSRHRLETCAMCGACERVCEVTRMFDLDGEAGIRASFESIGVCLDAACARSLDRIIAARARRSRVTA